MPNEKLKKYLNDIVWWIPFRKLRDFIRELVYTILEIKEQNNIILHFIRELNNNIDSNRNMIVVQMTNGLTDQLYIYRLGYSIEKLYNKKVIYDISFYETCITNGIQRTKRKFEILNIFNDFSLNIANENQIQVAKNFYIDGFKYINIDISETIKNNKILYLNTVNAWCPKIKLIEFDKIFDLDKYILPKLDNDNKRVYEDIKNYKHSVACHIRRTDYINHPYRKYKLLDENYFIKAIEKINKQIIGKLKIYFFSDDMDWVKNKLIPLVKNKYDYIAVDINDNDRGYFDFYLISNCKYQIASEGRFCETAHIFNKYKNKILITPNDIDEKYIRNK